MADNRIKKLGWLAPLALVVAGGLAACGDEDASDTRTAGSVEASLGSDQHLYSQAAEIEARTAVLGSDSHLYNQAAEIAARTAVVGSDVHLYNEAADIADTGPASDAGTVAGSAVMGSDVPSQRPTSPRRLAPMPGRTSGRPATGRSWPSAPGERAAMTSRQAEPGVDGTDVRRLRVPLPGAGRQPRTEDGVGFPAPISRGRTRVSG